ncbi:MAG: hypothetical protein MJE66_18845 [Proteobacteria bacterium]|nr:hypothetical protein [Pseudomonadota bacterium]
MASLRRRGIEFLGLLLLALGCGEAPTSFVDQLNRPEAPAKAEEAELEYYPAFTVTSPAPIATEAQARTAFEGLLTTLGLGDIADWGPVTAAPHYFYVQHQVHATSVLYVRRNGVRVRYYVERY